MVAKTRHASRPSRLKYLVLALQALGLYCYRKPTSDTVEISLPLLLWAIFVRTFEIIQTVTDVSRTHLSYTGNVGAVAEAFSDAVSTAIAMLGQSMLLIKNPILNQIILECEEEDSHSMTKQEQVGCSATIFSTDRITALLFYCSFVVVVYLQFSFINVLPDHMKLEMILFMVHGNAVVVGIMVTAALFREVLRIASRKLDADLLLDERVLQGGAEGLAQCLQMLERTLRKVSIILVSLLLCSFSN